jgi:hypothetical protein
MPGGLPPFPGRAVNTYSYALGIGMNASDGPGKG